MIFLLNYLIIRVLLIYSDRKWDKLYIIIGLGNPGKEYENTRHNTGFITIDKLAAKHNIEITKEKHKALVGSGVIAGEKVLLVKPQTFMNLSGEAAREVLDFYKEDVKNLIAIFDDIDLPVGSIRIKEKGSAGTHNGVKSLVKELGSQDFKRVKVGIGSPVGQTDLIGHVLGKFSKEDWEAIDKSSDNATDAVEIIIKDGINKAMNKYN